MKVTASSLKKGDFVELNGSIFTVVKFEHNFHGRGSANIRIKVKNVATGGTTENTFKPDNLIEQISVESTLMQFLFAGSDTLTFMNEQTYEQFELDKDLVGEFLPYLKEGQQMYVLFHNDKALAVRPPQSVRLQVIEAEDAVKGDTATNAKKPVTLETGAVVYVPLFIKKGEVITIDPETGSYIERA
ncbi:MAG: Elongation factor P [Microgenomates bacterium OLB23]|nr:MAG: Elongation factor P [Microgenomates bacterium OLB23]